MLMPVGGEHGVLLLRTNKLLKLFDPALAIVTENRVGHSGSDRGRLVLQNRATILGRFNGFSVKGHSALGSAENASAGLLFLLFGSLNTHTQALFAHKFSLNFRSDLQNSVSLLIYLFTL